MNLSLYTAARAMSVRAKHNDAIGGLHTRSLGVSSDCNAIWVHVEVFIEATTPSVRSAYQVEAFQSCTLHWCVANSGLTKKFKTNGAKRATANSQRFPGSITSDMIQVHEPLPNQTGRGYLRRTEAHQRVLQGPLPSSQAVLQPPPSGYTLRWFSFWERPLTPRTHHYRDSYGTGICIHPGVA